jgi:hypothetical protein
MHEEDLRQQEEVSATNLKLYWSEIKVFGNLRSKVSATNAHPVLAVSIEMPNIAVFTQFSAGITV